MLRRLNFDEKIEMVKRGENLNILINDEDYLIRAAVAEQGYGLDKLINDESEFVRIIVAEQGYGLDKLINDEDDWVRETAFKTQKEIKEIKHVNI